MEGLSVLERIKRLADVDLFKRDDDELATGTFVGRPFHLDYDRASLLIADAWKKKVFGIPQGCLLLAYYDAEDDVDEALLLRVLAPSKLPTDSDVIASMVEYYKDNLRTAGANSQLDTFTRYEFSFSGMSCRIIGTFYRNSSGGLEFGADVENFYSAHNYSVLMPNADVLGRIVNFREGASSGGPADIRIGQVRYSSSRRYAEREQEVPVYVTPKDFLGTRTALFGMTRTGKSNTVKKIIQATVAMSARAPGSLGAGGGEESDPAAMLDPFTEDDAPKYPVGQIVFDVNGEYANKNLQDEGTAIFEIYSGVTTRFSVIDKPGFKVMKTNFYTDLESGWGLIKSGLTADGVDYFNDFLAVDWTKPADYDTNRSAKTRWDRRRAAYLCCLNAAGFTPPPNFAVTFRGNRDINKLVRDDESLDPAQGLTLQEATIWWSEVWRQYNDPYFQNYKVQNNRDWADNDLQAILKVLTKYRSPGEQNGVSGYLKLRPIARQHTPTVGTAFDAEIVEELRAGRIVICDLSQGDPDLQRLFSERICRRVFDDSMARFISNKPNNFIQFYFEEAHNLFPKKDDKDLSQIYNRLAKEGAKLHLGLIYATQEVSSISSNILKNTQNWFIAHLNNEDETREIRKYYDFDDFTDGLTRYSASTDKGFVRMKTYSNAFVVPVQIDRFSARGSESAQDVGRSAEEH